jgi:hypothetical protein
MKNITRISLLIFIIASYQTAYCSEKSSRSNSQSGSSIAFQLNIETPFQYLTPQSSSNIVADDSAFNDVSSQPATPTRQLHISTSFTSIASSPFDALNPNHIQQKFFETLIDQEIEIGADTIDPTNDGLEIVIDEKVITQQFEELAHNCYMIGVKEMISKFVDESDNNMYCKFELSDTPFKTEIELKVPTSSMNTSISTTELSVQHLEEETVIPTLQNVNKNNATYFTAKNGLITATVFASVATGYWMMKKK